MTATFESVLFSGLHLVIATQLVFDKLPLNVWIIYVYCHVADPRDDLGGMDVARKVCFSSGKFTFAVVPALSKTHKSVSYFSKILVLCLANGASVSFSKL